MQAEMILENLNAEQAGQMPVLALAPRSAVWESVTPERVVPTSAQEQEHTIPARYHGRGYNTNAPERPLWVEVLRAIRSPCRPNLFRQAGHRWCLEYAVIVEWELAQRVAETLLRHRSDAALRDDLQRDSGLSLPNPCDNLQDDPLDGEETPEERYDREVYGDEWHTPMSL